MVKKFLWLALWVAAEVASSMTNGHAASDVISCYCDSNLGSECTKNNLYRIHRKSTCRVC